MNTSEPSGLPADFASAATPGGTPTASASRLHGLNEDALQQLAEEALHALGIAMPSVPAHSIPSLPRPPALPLDPSSATAPFYFLQYPEASETGPANLSPDREPRELASAAAATPSPERRAFEVMSIRKDFPILAEPINGRQLVWLDNAATTQKPQAVIDRLAHFYAHENSNIHRAAHTLAARATDAYESAREKVRAFLNAPSSREIVFVRGATEAINLVAQSWGRRHIYAGDEIVLTELEHHSNIVPWQLLAEEKGAKVRVAPIDRDGQIVLDEFEKLLGPRTRLVAFAHVSNALGTITPVKAMVEAAHRHGAKVLVDGAQAVSHLRVDVQALDPDFYVLSGHKIFAPTGIGALYGKPEALAEMPPWQGGGNMIEDVTFERSTFQQPPARFEAGTGSIADAVGLGAAIDYLESVGIENVTRHEHDLLVYATEELRRIPGLRLIGTAREKAAVISLVIQGLTAQEVGAALDREGIAVRAGHHCAQPAVRCFGVENTVRPSLALYNTKADVDALVAALDRIASARRGP